ncbi:hypothetical protein [Jannaschia pohangensis]|uniref:DUF485 domain-containing protein n=1 Tax=Jannaschia pohangensis TaxID=390807 RepID=A0A1I3JE82_9RHOB|nr:hypothetical protein [Jannaschia pohangensis]SFI58577.1 hypothetical protein SAMN04488095_1297 [Jannaschia pohangensis]
MSDLLDPAANAAQRRARMRSRIADAARLLPFLGGVLFLVPDLVLSGSATEGATAPWLAYLFVAWAALIGCAFWIARLHARARDDDGAAPAPDSAL